MLLGGGPSLTIEQVDQVWAAHKAGAVKCVAVNDSYLLAPFADVLYFADWEWWEWNTQGTAKPALDLTAAQVRERFALFAGLKCSIENATGTVKDDTVHVLRNFHSPGQGVGLSLDPGKLVTGRNSGFQALNLAILAGSKTIILLGYDGKPAPGKTHFFGEHPRATDPEAYVQFRQSFIAAEWAIRAVGVRVVNCSPDSAIESFEKTELGEALENSDR